jgi:hypothetical protein
MCAPFELNRKEPGRESLRAVSVNRWKFAALFHKMASFLPVPSIREIWAAKGGGLFFLKWMGLSGAQMVLSFLSRSTLTTTMPGISIVYNGFLWFLPPFLPALALFGFHWRTLVWGGATITVFVATAAIWPQVPGLPPDILEQLLRFSLPLAGLAILPHALLLVNIRRRPLLWVLTYPAAIFVSHQIIGDRLTVLLWQQLNGIMLPGEFVRLINNCLPGLTGAALMGLLLIWLMPPVKEPETWSIDFGEPVPFYFVNLILRPWV